MIHTGLNKRTGVCRPSYIDNFISSQSVTLAVRSWGTKATWGVREDCLQDMVLSMDVQCILRQERYTPDSQSIISRVESPWPRTADNDTSVQSQPPWPGTTQWGRPSENLAEVGFLWCLSAAGRRVGCPVQMQCLDKLRGVVSNRSELIDCK